MSKISVKTGDITKEKVCAIVNAANSSLMGGDGVDGAIHSAGGPGILDECREIRQKRFPDGLPTGECAATNAGDLPAKYVIHTVGPIYHQCGDKCTELLTMCYSNALKTAVDLGCKDIAFPAISTGIYGYPKEKAAKIAYTTVEDFLKGQYDLNVTFIFHNEKDEALFRKNMEAR